MLINPLRQLLSKPEAQSFQLLGEDLVLLSGAKLRQAVAIYEAELARTVPSSIRPLFEDEQAEFLSEAHTWLKRFNQTIHTRIRGYLALGRLCNFEYPWPTIAVLGICEVLERITRARVYGLVGKVARHLVRYGEIEELASQIDDILLRTNRSIFADSVPTVLMALRCHNHRSQGADDLAEALLSGPLTPLMDEESRELCRGLYQALAVDESQERFSQLVALTLRHFHREQAILTSHLEGTLSQSKESSLANRLMRISSVSAPVIESTSNGCQLVFKPYKLPTDFDLKDHGVRVNEFACAFIISVTSKISDYQVAVDYVVRRFGEKGERAVVTF